MGLTALRCDIIFVVVKINRPRTELNFQRCYSVALARWKFRGRACVRHVILYDQENLAWLFVFILVFTFFHIVPKSGKRV